MFQSEEVEQTLLSPLRDTPDLPDLRKYPSCYSFKMLQQDSVGMASPYCTSDLKCMRQHGGNRVKAERGSDITFQQFLSIF